MSLEKDTEPEAFLYGDYLMLLNGQIRAKHVIACSNCPVKGIAFVDMTIVEGDKLIGPKCPVCGEESLEIVTYELQSNE